MHDSKRMTRLQNTDNDPNKLGCLSLTVMSLLNDPIKELPTLTKLHYQVNRDRILISALDSDDVGMFRQMVHYLNLPPNIVIVLFAQKLALRDGLTGVIVASLLVSAKKSSAKLALAELLAEGVEIGEGLGPIREDP